MRIQDLHDTLHDTLDRYYRPSKQNNNIAIAALVVSAAAAGVVAGMLFAPDSGETTRARLKWATSKAVNNAKDKATEVKDTATEKVASVADSAKGAISEGKRAYNENEASRRSSRRRS